jgi:raffinose/stachyose/melibiose transport system permease protein
MDGIALQKRKQVMIYSMLIILSIIWLVPLLSTLNQALLNDGWNNFVQVLTFKYKGLSLGQIVLNSVIIASWNVVLVTMISALAGYGFSKINFWGKELIYYAILLCLSIPHVSVLFPIFMTIKGLGIMNSYMSIIGPEVSFALPFAIMVCRNYYDGIPNELLEAAFMDGANRFQIFNKIMLPLGRPMLINIGVLSFLWSWNDLLFPLVFLTKKSMMTVTLSTLSFKYTFQVGGAPNRGLYNASMLLLAVPTIIVYLIFQKYIQQGMTSGAVKG